MIIQRLIPALIPDFAVGKCAACLTRAVPAPRCGRQVHAQAGGAIANPFGFEKCKNIW